MNKHGSVAKNAVGDVFGRLTIVRRAGSDKLKRALWECECECGNTVTLPGTRLGKTVQSCGCLRRDMNRGAASHMWSGAGSIPGKYWGQVVGNAVARNVEITITIQDAWLLFEQQHAMCALTGLPLLFTSVKGNVYRSTHGTASLDRIDNSKGYVPGNVQWIHKDINIMKKDHELTYFIDMCALVAKYHKKG